MKRTFRHATFATPTLVADSGECWVELNDCEATESYDIDDLDAWLAVIENSLTPVADLAEAFEDEHGWDHHVAHTLAEIVFNNATYIERVMVCG